MKLLEIGIMKGKENKSLRHKSPNLCVCVWLKSYPTSNLISYVYNSLSSNWWKAETQHI